MLKWPTNACPFVKMSSEPLHYAKVVLKLSGRLGSTYVYIVPKEITFTAVAFIIS